MLNVKDCLKKYIEYVKEKTKHGINPATALDYSSLYPSLIMTYNLSPEYLVVDENHKEELETKYNLHPINFKYEYKDYQEVEKSRDIIAWTVRHNNDHKFGLYPEILRDLFRQRAEMKKSLFIYKEKKEHIEKEFNGDKELLDANKEYQDCLFQLKYCDTKQKALKVYMNCFYGELGNKNSPLFILALAGGITSAGQMNLRKVKSYIENRGCKTYYGDTDSLYFTFSDETFMPIHKQFLTKKHNNLSKEEYCTKLVEQTFKSVKSMAIDVNTFLKNDNGTEYLKMAYEEVLFPVVFLSRKKYYGIAHEGLVNFKPKELFIRGLEVKKRGVSEILRIVCLETMWESMNIFNHLSLRELVMNKVDYIFSRQWELTEFTQTGLWKPNKKNQTLITYVNRMIAEGRDPPNPYERFNYVIVKIKDPMRLYDFKGRKIDIKKGDKMEYLDYVLENGLEIDLDYYFSKQLIGQFARLISYDNEFHEFKQTFSSGDFLEDNQMEILDDKTMNNCKKFIKEYAKRYTGEEQYGNMYKKAYRTINSLVREERKMLCGKNSKAMIMFNHSDELTEGKIVDVRVIIKDKVKSVINDEKIKKTIEAESYQSWKNMKTNNMDITKLFNKKKNSFLNNLMETHQKNYEKSTMELIKFTKDKKIDNIIFNTGEQNIAPVMKKILCGNKDIFEDEDKLEVKIKELYYISNGEKELNKEDMETAYKMFINIVAIKKNKKILKNIMKLNISSIEKKVNKNQTKFIEGFRL